MTSPAYRAAKEADDGGPFLKPCPFCGNEGSSEGTVTYSREHVISQDWEQSTFYFCNCPRCGVSNMGVVGHLSRADAIAAWNRRAARADKADV